ncbi:hypothetical protein H7S74_16890 [Priestia aryabhattai]|uniref:hypothetical protein n=1 Tax=Priestia TaxID=2800373 RepID=UPI001EC139D3|nr:MULTISPECIES: hypothetical protein [Priestia]MBY0092598.1 hypothetical protein [Priestia aryabhattai]MBY0103041.1 hypothetical protein [Priestia aryabhattai]MCY9023614.1 keratin [Priestia megaterium]
MKLFKGDTIKKVNKLMDNAEKRKQKLENKVQTLQEEVKLLSQAVQDDLTQAIHNDVEPSNKLENDLGKVIKELEVAKFQLSQIDSVVKAELEKAKEEVDKERKEFMKDKGDDFRKKFDEIHELKMAYLEKIVEYSKMKSKYNSEYQETFREIEDRVGLRRNDPRDQFHISLNQMSQSDRHYNPMVYLEELRSVLQGELPYLAVKNKDLYKN